MQRTVRLRIHGCVQGVWYRGWTVEQARDFGLVGWVRNRRDGSVEAVVCGPIHAVDDMILACRDGPPAARVDTVEVEEVAPAEAGGSSGFVQRETV